MTKSGVGKLLYGALFVIVLPVLLVVWASETREVVKLPAIHSLPWGVGAITVGSLLVALGMASLWLVGGGLPMNAFPPPRYVSSGIYGLFSHPIYAGFSLVCVGTAIAAGSASGLWLVSTTVVLASTALVLGYELPDLQRRFGSACPGQRLLPADDQSLPSGMERLRCYLTVLVPWFLIYEAFVALGVPPDAKIAYLPFEFRLPVLPWTEMFYGSVYVMVLLVPLIVAHATRSSPLLQPGLAGDGDHFPSLPRGAADCSAPVFHCDRAIGGVAESGSRRMTAPPLRSLPTTWSGHLSPPRPWPATRWQKRAWRAWAVLASASCVTTGMHALVDVAAGFLVGLAVIRMDRVWSFLRSSSEKIANSWREWRIGSGRVINHGAYAGAGVFVGIWIIDTLLGPGKSAIPIAIFLGGCVGAALWAQVIEGSPALLRPLGFYGGMIGTWTCGAIAAWWTRTAIWPVLAALVVAAPWIQGIGRLRCLVQGCCHGRPAAELVGIRYTHPRSRVWRVLSLRGVPVHATPLYSLLWNVVVALVVTRIYLLHASSAMVGGVYLILSSAGRFVEEAYRGEPQTPVLGGLRLYQWVAVVTMLLGAMITTIRNSAPSPPPALHFSSIFVALACGLGAWFLTGVDFPESNRRFARLT